MALECSYDLASDLAKSCSNPVAAGIEQDGWIFNYDDIDVQATLAEYEPALSSVINLHVRVGKKGYKCTNLANYVNTKVDGTYENTFQKVITGAILDDGAGISNIIEALGSKNGRFIMVIANKHINYQTAIELGVSAFEIIGLLSPMNSEGQSIVNDKNSADSRGGWLFGLQTNELKPHIYFGDAANYTANKAAFDALGTPAV